MGAETHDPPLEAAQQLGAALAEVAFLRRLSGVSGTIEFIRRVNGLADVQEVHRIVHDAEAGSFRLAAQLDFLEREADSIAALRQRRALAFAVERAAWAQAGEFAQL